MASSTMKNLRKLKPIASTPAILKDHRLAFNVPGTPFIEPSWASVEIEKGSIVHGVLYKLTEDDFATICQTEGVPFAYKLHRCEVMPYIGDGVDAGRRMWLDGCSNTENDDDDGDDGDDGDGDDDDSDDSDDSAKIKLEMVKAFTLRAGRKSWRESNDIPPSKSYINVLLKGAKEFQLDEDYVQALGEIKCSEITLGDGIAEKMLQLAEMQQQK